MPENAVLEGDLQKISELPHNDAAFVRLWKIGVCSDDEKINGIQFSLKVREPNFADVEDDPTGGMMNTAKPMITKMLLNEEDIGKEFHGEVVGTFKAPCEWWGYNPKNKLSEIDIYTDGTRLRKMTIKMLNGQ